MTWPVCDHKEEKPAQPEEGKIPETAEDQKKKDPQDLFNVYESYDQLPKDYKGNIRGTMFPDTLEKMRDVYKIQHTVRLMPHDQNTGGFYLALIRKKNHVVFGGRGPAEHKIPKAETASQNVVPGPEEKIQQEEDDDQAAIKKLGEEINEEEALKHAVEAEDKDVAEGGQSLEIEQQDQKTNQNKGKGGKKSKQEKEQKKKDMYQEINAKDWEWISEYYGLKDEALRKLFIQQNPGDKKIWMVSPGIKKVLDLDYNRCKNLLSV